MAKNGSDKIKMTAVADSPIGDWGMEAQQKSFIFC